MARKLAANTLKKFRNQLESERIRLERMIAEHVRELEEARQTETSAERSPDPGSAEAGSMNFEFEKELSLGQNTVDLLRKVERALGRVADGTYGICESCGTQIPVARLEVLPYATECVSCARRT
ncbi:MAG: TraR/DksA C4-type zinc finger protein [Actinobacteria bacterium]|nr:TraR/DksA C4-type zinc finger protein [Actinomycetota bacterium]MDQ3501697.1 TraR/DksA C4-type zinc finger protein [Actinomycetota bacterium]